jgi:hypothetical protein
LSRKALPIKKDDAQPLFRNDIQYDLLDSIFSDGHKVFTSPHRGKTKVNFRDLYVEALYNSNKCSKVLKDKMLETPAFAIELAKISLLTNVGRINTTMACELFIVSVTARHVLSRINSFPRDEDRSADVSPDTVPAEDRRKCARCTPHQELSQSRALAVRIQGYSSINAR